MNIDNLERAIACKRELDTFHKNLIVINKMMDKAKDGKLGLLFQEHSDGSGLATEQFYLNGNYHKEMMDEIIKAIFMIVVRHEEELRMEIDEL